MTDTSSTCYKLSCGAVVAGEHAYCPHCGGRMKSERTVRTLGWVMVAIGLFLIGLMALILNAIGPALDAASGGGGVSTDGQRFSGSAEAAQAVTRLLWTILGFGVIDLANGLYQGISGRRSKVMNIAMMLCALAMAFLAAAAVLSIKAAA